MRKEYREHVSKGITKELRTFVNEVALVNANHIFYKRKGSKQEAYCTKCKNDFVVTGLRHNEYAECPVCKKEFKCKSDGKRRKTLIHGANILVFEKSIKDEKVLVARGFTLRRSFEGDYRNVEDEYIELANYVFEERKSTMVSRGYYWGWDGYELSKWAERATIHNFTVNSLANLPYYISFKSLEEAIKGTYLKYSCYENFEGIDILKYLDFYNKYPGIEKLIKIGLGNIVKTKLDGLGVGRCINWRGKDIYKMLKLSKKDYRELIKSKVAIRPITLELYQLNCKFKEKDRLTLDDIKDLEYIIGTLGDAHNLRKVLRYTTIKKAYNYINKQFKNRGKGQYHSCNGVLITWGDYIEDCKKLNIDLNIESNLFPKSVYRAHQNTIKQVEYKNNLEMDNKIEKRLEKLSELTFEYKDLIIRPALNSTEIIREGKEQVICIGSYVDKYANGMTNLFFIRKKGEEEKPFFAVEISKEWRVIQVRGKRNCLETKEVKEFMEAFEIEKLNNKKKKSKVA